jgi:nucleoside-diphosphate-sugar epimerase
MLVLKVLRGAPPTPFVFLRQKTGVEPCLPYTFFVILLLGKYGNLAKSVQTVLMHENLRILGSQEIQEWTIPNSADKILEYFKQQKIKPNVIINATGIVDGFANREEQINVNFHLPKNLLDFSIKTNVKLITFGTIMENFKGIANSNSYLKSKTDYFEYLTSITVNPHNTIHLQIHTWYGGYRLHNTMFLGQIYDAIKSGKAFRMSSGLQLREYHHIEDDLEALKHLLSIDCKGILQINHGISITLKDIATHLFSHFNSLELIKIGDVATPVQENFTRKFVVPESLKGIAFRNPLEGITDYFSLLLNGESPSHHLHSKE